MRKWLLPDLSVAAAALSPMLLCMAVVVLGRECPGSMARDGLYYISSKSQLESESITRAEIQRLGNQDVFPSDDPSKCVVGTFTAEECVGFIMNPNCFYWDEPANDFQFHQDLCEGNQEEWRNYGTSLDSCQDFSLHCQVPIRPSSWDDWTGWDKVFSCGGGCYFCGPNDLVNFSCIGYINPPSGSTILIQEESELDIVKEVHKLVCPPSAGGLEDLQQILNDRHPAHHDFDAANDLEYHKFGEHYVLVRNDYSSCIVDLLEPPASNHPATCSTPSIKECTVEEYYTVCKGSNHSDMTCLDDDRSTFQCWEKQTDRWCEGTVRQPFLSLNDKYVETEEPRISDDKLSESAVEEQIADDELRDQEGERFKPDEFDDSDNDPHDESTESRHEKNNDAPVSNVPPPNLFAHLLLVIMVGGGLLALVLGLLVAYEKERNRDSSYMAVNIAMRQLRLEQDEINDRYPMRACNGKV